MASYTDLEPKMKILKRRPNYLCHALNLILAIVATAMLHGINQPFMRQNASGAQALGNDSAALPTEASMKDQVAASGTAPTSRIPIAIPQLPFAGLPVRDVLAQTIPTCANVPTASHHPVDFGEGQKLENAVDVVVALRGDDFEFHRMYSSKPVTGGGLGGDSGPSALGLRWSSNVMQNLVHDIGNNEITVTGPEGGQATFAYDEEDEVWWPLEPSTQFIEKATITLDVGSGAQDWAVWKHVEPGSWTCFYYREPDELEDVEDLPNGLFNGALLQRRDVYNNQWTWQWAVCGVRPGMLSGVEEGARPKNIFLNPDKDTITNWAAKVEMAWNDGSADPPAPADAMGKLAELTVKRRVATEESVTDVVELDYYISSLMTCHEDVGTGGDLVQVVRKQRTNADDQWHVTVTQYRYHDGLNEEDLTEDDDGDGIYGERGLAHQLKAVILPEQMEYVAELANDGSTTIEEFATGLLGIADEGVIEDSRDYNVMDLAAKVIARYETSTAPEQGRVLTQYIQTAEAATSGKGHGLRLDYQYLDYSEIADPEPEYERTTIITESRANFNASPTTYSVYRKLYYDLKKFDSEISGSTRSRFVVGIEAIEEWLGPEDPERQWVTKYIYDDETRDLIKVCTPSSITEYTPGVGGEEPEAPSADESYTVGLILQYGYTPDHRLSSVGIATTSDPENIVEIQYGDEEDTDGRPYLPKEITRSRVANASAANDKEITQFKYAFHNSSSIGDGHDDAIAWVEMAVEGELVTENGPDSAVTHYTHEFFDATGLNIASRAADDSLTRRIFDSATGGATSVTLNAASSGFPSSSGTSGGSFAGRNSDGGTLTYSASYDELGRLIALSQPSGVTTRVFRMLRMPKERDNFGSGNPHYLTTIVLPHKTGTSDFAGPAIAYWQSAGGIVFQQGTYGLLAPSSGEGEFFDLFGSAYDYSLNTGTADALALSRQIVDTSLSGLTTATRAVHRVATNALYETEFTYDELGRLAKTETPNGTITRYTLDVRGRATNIEVGTDDGSPGNMSTIAEYFWDCADHDDPDQGVGNGQLCVIKTDSGETSGVRTSKFYYDRRDRLFLTRSSASPDQYMQYDHLDRVVAAAAFQEDHAPDDPNIIDDETAIDYRLSYGEIAYTQRGLPYRMRIAIDPEDDIHFLDTNTWYDESGRVVGHWAPNSPSQKISYNGLGQPIALYVSDRGGDAQPGASGNYASVYSTSTHRAVVTGDVVFEEISPRYIETDDYPNDAFAGLADLTTHKRRTHLASDSDTGALSSLTSTKSITTYDARFYDNADRVIRTVQYGTNLATDIFNSGGAAPTVDQETPLNWNTTGYELVSEITYHATRGAPETLTDAMGRQTKLFYDDLNRVVAFVENHENATISWSSGDSRWAFASLDDDDVDRATSFVLDWAGRTTKRCAHIKNGSADSVQLTTYVYGTTKGTNDSDSLVASNELLREIIYPEESSGSPSVGDRTATYQYNRLGELRYSSDQQGSAHKYRYDAAGRMTLDHVTAFGTDIDSFINAITSQYDTLGRLELVKSVSGYGTSPSTKNAVKFHYDALGQVTKVYQNPLGEVDDDGSGTDSPVVINEYASSVVTSSAAGNYHRPTKQTYPTLTPTYTTYHYGTASSSNDRISRAMSLKHADGTREVKYSYIGLDMLAKVDYVTPNVQLDYTATSAGGRAVAGQYPGYDRFGRVRQQMWVDGGYANGSGATPNKPQIYFHSYTYDKNSNRLTAYDTRPGINQTGATQQKLSYEHAYDELNRLKETKRGVKNGSTWHDGLNSQSWTLDVLNNSTLVKTDANGSGSYGSDEEESRTHNGVNELTVSDLTTASADRQYSYNKLGSLRSTETSGSPTVIHQRCTYDAWNRLVKVDAWQTSSSTAVTIAEYQYDGLNRRIVKRIDSAVENGSSPDGTIDQQTLLFYNEQWQCVVEHIYDGWSSGSPGNVDRWAYSIYGFQHIDEVVARVYDSGPSTKTYYHLHDPQFSTVVVLEDNGRLSERIDYWANGFARHHHMGDVDGDGDRGSDDQGFINNPTNQVSIGNAAYHAEADINRDGTINSTDYGFVSSATFTALPLGRLSDVKVYNNVGYSGYRYEAITKLYQVRFREFDPFRGRWLQRDPAGYMDSNNLYSYIAGNPIGWLDPFGLQGGGGVPINSSDPTQFGSMINATLGDVFAPHFTDPETGCNPPSRSGPNRIGGTPFNNDTAPLKELGNRFGNGLSGAGAGAVGGAGTGALTGAAVGSLGFGVGAGPGAGIGALSGALTGAFLGFIEGFMNPETRTREVMAEALVTGGIGGFGSGATAVSLRILQRVSVASESGMFGLVGGGTAGQGVPAIMIEVVGGGVAVGVATGIAAEASGADEAIINELKKAGFIQNHHFATDKHKQYTPQMKAITDKYGLDLNDEWNKEHLLQNGRHPHALWDWVLDQMIKADKAAKGDRDLFLELFEQTVKEPIRKNPGMLRSPYWNTL